MRIAYVEIRNFRGILELGWAPAPGINCLIGPGDSTKTTVLDAIELALNPRSYAFADDSDFFNLDVGKPVEITVTLVDLPASFIADDRYGMHLRGWDADKLAVADEPGDGLEEALSVRVTIDNALEARWQLFNERIGGKKEDPPALRYKDAQLITTTRLGPYAERHLGWGRQSVLTRLGEADDNVQLRLAEASRAARDAFRQGSQDVFKQTVERAQELGKKFSVPVRSKYVAELDVQGVNITAGGVSLHDGGLPLRRLGTGSSRLIVSALQHDAGGSHVALIDEVEHGLEPHRIARLLNFLKAPAGNGEAARSPQIFMTTHSPVVIRELQAGDICAVRSEKGVTEVRSVAATAKDLDTAQRHLRRTPEAFLANRVIVGEGRTEYGLVRGLDLFWTENAINSFALCGVTAIDGGGNPNALMFAEHLLDLGYEVFLLLDTDEEPDAEHIKRIGAKGGGACLWPDSCSTEERVFLDVPWDIAKALVKLAEEYVGTDAVLAHIRAVCQAQGLGGVEDLVLPEGLDNAGFRRVLGRAAKNKSNPWFKDIGRGERLAAIVAPCLEQIPDTPLVIAIGEVRQWVNG